MNARRTAVVVGAAVCSIAVGVAAAAEPDSPPERDPSRIELAMRGPVADEGGAIERLARADDTERAQLRTDLRRLSAAWASAGGSDGFPFWERAWRRYEAGGLAASAMRDYTKAYLDLLERERGQVEDEGVETDVARQVREQLARALELRADALSSMVAYLEDKRPGTAVDRDLLRDQLRELQADLQASYKATRIAMNTAQASLAAAGSDPLSESAFL